jgi:hypothetical protein
MQDATFRMPASLCPGCGKKLDACTAIGEPQPPKRGDITVCFGCGMLLEFGEGLVLQQLKDLGSLDDRTRDQLLRAQEQIILLRGGPGRA